MLESARVTADSEEEKAALDIVMDFIRNQAIAGSNTCIPFCEAYGDERSFRSTEND